MGRLKSDCLYEYFNIAKSILYLIKKAPYFGGAVLGVRFCLLYGPGILSGWLRELREFFRKS